MGVWNSSPIITSKPLGDQKFEHHGQWRINEEEITLEDLDLSVVILLGLDTLVKYVIFSHDRPPKNANVAQTKLHVTNEFIYLKKNIMSSFNMVKVRRHLHK